MSATPSTILVVEDDAIVRMLIVDVLQELEFSVLEADGSERALELLEDTAQTIDLLMTDVGLPGMDGRALASKAREKVRISAREATSNKAGLVSDSGQVLRSSVAGSLGTANAPRHTSQADRKRAMRTDSSPFKNWRHYNAANADYL